MKEISQQEHDLLHAVANMLNLTRTFDGYDDYSRGVPEGFTDARLSLLKAFQTVTGMTAPSASASQADA